MKADATLYQTLRIVDANLNRIGEGLRLLENLARLLLNDATLSQQLKAMRHSLITGDQSFNQQLLQAREVRRLIDRSSPDHELRLARQDRFNQLADVGGAVLIVGIRIDDDVRAVPHALVQARQKGGGESLITRKLHDVVDATAPSDLDRPIRASVIDDQPLNNLHAFHAARQLGKRDRQRLLFVVAGNLND